MRSLTALLIGIITTAPAVSAQRCSYDQCALRLQYRSSGVRIVQGIGAAPIARIGFYAPRVSLLADGDDSTRSHYEAFREHHNRGANLGLVSLAFLVGGAVAYYSTDQDSRRWPGIGLYVIGFGVSLGAAANRRRSQDELSRSVWFFNRALTGP